MAEPQAKFRAVHQAWLLIDTSGSKNLAIGGTAHQYHPLTRLILLHKSSPVVPFPSSPILLTRLMPPDETWLPHEI